MKCIFALLIMIPLLISTYVGYNRDLWRVVGGVDLLPFPTPLSVYSPVWAWHGLFWGAVFIGIVFSFMRDDLLILLIMILLTKGGYFLLGKVVPFSKTPPSVQESEVPLTTFGIWHNAFIEEMLFRGFPFLVIYVLGISHHIWVIVLYALVTSLLFGLYHFWRVHPIRFFDTFLFGLLLAFLTWKYGIASAFIVHTVHNILSVPMNTRVVSDKTWWHGRKLYLLITTVVTIIGVSLRLM